jgi:hypothetical protein
MVFAQRPDGGDERSNRRRTDDASLGAARTGDRSPQKRVEAASAQRAQQIDDENEHGERQGGAEREELDADALGVLKHEDDQRCDEHNHDRQIKPAHEKSLPGPRNAGDRAGRRFGLGSTRAAQRRDALNIRRLD